MAAGFVTSRPGARFGDTWNSVGTYNHNCEWAFKFVCPGSGLQNITEIGYYVQQPDSTPPASQMAIFTHDAANDCPDTIVANSQSSTIGGASASWYYAALTSCQVTGGQTYWICFLEGQEDEISCLSGTGAGLYKTGLTPYTFSTGDEWHTHTNLTSYTPDVYAVYSAAAEIQPNPASAVCNKINPQIGADPYLLASVFRRFPSQELEDIEFEDEQQRDTLFWVEDKPGLAADDIIEDFFEYSGIPEPLVVLPAAINAVCTKVDPYVVPVTTYITPAARNAIGSRNNPVIQLYITPAARNAIVSHNNPSILVTPPLTITPAAINSVSSSVNPAVIIPVMVTPSASYAVAGKVNPAIQLYITPEAIYAIANKFDPNVPINTIAGSAVMRGVDPYGLVTPPVVVSFEMWRDSIPTVVDPFVLINPLLTDAIPAGTVCHVVNPYVYVLGGEEYVLPDAASAIVVSIDPTFVLNALQIIELISRISIQLELASIIKTELNLDSNIYNLLELDSKIPERMTVEPPPAGAIFDTAKFDEVIFQ